MAIKPLTKPSKPRKNRVTKDWLKFRRQWLKQNPADHAGRYLCGICGMHVHKDVVQLDHIQERSTHPELRLDPANIRPAHPGCNYGRKA